MSDNGPKDMEGKPGVETTFSISTLNRAFCLITRGQEGIICRLNVSRRLYKTYELG